MGLVDTISDLYLQKGKAQAQGQERVGQLYGSLISNLGQIPGQVQQQEQQRQTRDLENQKLSFELQAAKQQATARAAFGRIMGQAVNKDGSLNRQPFIDALPTNPDLASQWPEISANLDKAEEASNAARKSRTQAAQDEIDQADAFVDTASLAKDPADRFGIFSQLMGHAASPEGGATINADHAASTIAQGLGPDGNPDSDKVDALFTRIKSLSSTAKATRAKLNEPTKMSETDRIVIPATGQTVVAGGPKPITNETELLADAATLGTPQETPTAKASKAALDLKNTPTAYQQSETAARAQSAEETARHNRVMEALSRARVNVTGQQAKDDADAIADAIERGDQPPDLARLYSRAGPVRVKLARDGYDLTKATQDWTAQQKYLSTLNGQQQTRLRQAIAFTSDTLPTIRKLVSDWDAGKFPLLNKAVIGTAKQGGLGPEAQSLATRLDAQIADLTSELGTVYKGGNSSTDESLKLAAQNLQSNWSKQTALDALDQIEKNLAIRTNSMKATGVAGTPNNQYAPPTAAPAKDPLGIR